MSTGNQQTLESPELKALQWTPKRSKSTHAYAIVTTSTALSTGSNNTNSMLSHHSFSPHVPNKWSRPHVDRRLHRYSKSLTTLDRPPSLPPPPMSPSRKTRLNHARSDFGASSLHSDSSDLESESNSDDSDNSELRPLEHSVLIGVSGSPVDWEPFELSSYLDYQGNSELSSWVLATGTSGREFIFNNSQLTNAAPVHLRNDINRQVQILRGKSDFSYSSSTNQGIAGKVKEMVQAIERTPFPLNKSKPEIVSSDEGPLYFDVSIDNVEKKNRLTQPLATKQHLVQLNNFRNTSSPESDTTSYFSAHLESQESTMQELLESPNAASFSQIWGAKAWEEDTKPVLTVKHLTRAQSTDDIDGLADLQTCKSQGILHLFGSSELKPTESQHIGGTKDNFLGGNVCDLHATVIKQLRSKVSTLERQIKVLQAQDRESTGVNPGSCNPDSVDFDDPGISQYLVMLGVGICAIAGQTFIKKLLVRNL